MGNSLYHDALYRVLLRYPGITVIHDLGLHDFMAARTLGQGDFISYARELGYALGPNGVELAYQIRQGQAEPPFAAVPLNERVFDHGLGVIVAAITRRAGFGLSGGIFPSAIVPAPICIDPGPFQGDRPKLGALRTHCSLPVRGKFMRTSK